MVEKGLLFLICEYRTNDRNTSLLASTTILVQGQIIYRYWISGHKCNDRQHICIVSKNNTVRCLIGTYQLNWWWYSLVSDTLQPQAPLSMELSRQEYWSWFPFPPLGYLPIPGIKPTSLRSPAWQTGYFLLYQLGIPILTECSKLMSPIMRHSVPPGKLH